MTIHPPDKRLVVLADKEMRRLHALLAPIQICDSDGGYRSKTRIEDNPCAEWARKQLELFHQSLVTGSAAIVTSQETKKDG